VAGARAARELAVLRQVEHPNRAALGTRRADDARPHRPRRAATAARADQAINALEREIGELVSQVAPQLLTEPGFGPLTAAKLVGEIAGAGRSATDAKLARSAGLAAIPVSSGRTDRHRLDHGGNRQINAAIHRVVVTRSLPSGNNRVRRPQAAEGKTHRKAIRCLKRQAPRPPHLADPSSAPPRVGNDATSINFLTKEQPQRRSQGTARHGRQG
jgi:transposase